MNMRVLNLGWIQHIHSDLEQRFHYNGGKRSKSGHISRHGLEPHGKAQTGWVCNDFSRDLSLLLEEDAGHECQFSVPVIKEGSVVEGHDRHKCHLNLNVKILKALPRTTAAPKKKRVSKSRLSVVGTTQKRSGLVAQRQYYTLFSTKNHSCDLSPLYTVEDYKPKILSCSLMRNCWPAAGSAGSTARWRCRGAYSYNIGLYFHQI